MKINDTWSIERDALNFILVETKVTNPPPKDGVEQPPGTSESRSYYQTIELACIVLIRKSINIESLQSVIDSIDQSKKDIVKAIRNTENTK